MSWRVAPLRVVARRLPWAVGYNPFGVKDNRLLGLLALGFLASGLLACGGDKIAPGKIDALPGLDPPSRSAEVRRQTQPVWHEAVGTLHSRSESTVAARITASVRSVEAEVGVTVAAGQLLARLDEREIDARLEQARSARKWKTWC